MLPDIMTDVIIIVARRDIYIGRVMTTGTTWTDHTSGRFGTTRMNIMSGKDTTEGMGNVKIMTTDLAQALCGVKRFRGRFTDPPFQQKGFFIMRNRGFLAYFEQSVPSRIANQPIYRFYQSQ